MSKSLYTRSLACVGILLSCYALYVEHKTSHPDTTPAPDGSFIEEEFQALCDIEAIGASCSKVFNLPEGRMLTYFGIVPHDSILDVPNAFLGLLYYSIMFMREQFLPKNGLFNTLTVVMNCAAMTSSVWLATKLVILRELCILCWTTHLLNLLLLLYYGRQLTKSNKAKQA
eukprot:936365_1